MRRHRTESLTSPRRLAAAERQRQALALRMGGADFTQIAQALGFSNRSGAFHAVQAALKRVPEPEAKTYRTLNLERLNFMRLQFQPRLRKGDLDAMDMELKVQNREARYLGLDAPVRSIVTGPDGKPIQVVISFADLVQSARKTLESGTVIEGQLVEPYETSATGITESVDGRRDGDSSDPN